MKGLMKRSTVALLVLAGMGMSASVISAPVNIDIKGTVVASACDQNVVGGNGNVIDLGEIQASTLLSANSYSAYKEFQIALTNCPATTTGFKAEFSGTLADSPAVNLFKNTGDATRVEIDLRNATTDTTVVGTPISGTITNNAAEVKLKTRAYSTQGQATPGSIMGTIQVTFTYS